MNLQHAYLYRWHFIEVGSHWHFICALRTRACGRRLWGGAGSTHICRTSSCAYCKYLTANVTMGLWKRLTLTDRVRGAGRAGQGSHPGLLYSPSGCYHLAPSRPTIDGFVTKQRQVTIVEAVRRVETGGRVVAWEPNIRHYRILSVRRRHHDCKLGNYITN